MCISQLSIFQLIVSLSITWKFSRRFQQKSGREDLFKPTVRNESLHETNNDKVITVVNFATSCQVHNVPAQNIHKYTWDLFWLKDCFIKYWLIWADIHLSLMCNLSGELTVILITSLVVANTGERLSINKWELQNLDVKRSNPKKLNDVGLIEQCQVKILALERENGDFFDNI